MQFNFLLGQKNFILVVLHSFLKLYCRKLPENWKEVDSSIYYT